MHSFKDNAGREWSVEINVAAVKRLRGCSLKIDLMEALGGTVLERLATDPILLVDTLYVLCKPQADAEQITDEQFGEGMAGDAIERAGEAFLAELLDFFQQRQRPVLAKILGKIDEAQARATEATLTALDDPAVDAAIERQLIAGRKEMLSRLATLGASSGSALESSG